jgi:hypothetical protein
MIHVNHTPRHAGVTVMGDYQDFDRLYNALHEVVGEEGELSGYEGARLRVLGVCYDLRHAMMGDREVLFVDNGIDDDKKRRLAILAPDKNVYLSFQVLWPELLFVMLALNEFIGIYEGRRKRALWDSNVASVRLFQSAVASCLKGIVSENVFARILNVMNGRLVGVQSFCTQYLDEWNGKFLKMKPEKRVKQISVIAKRLAEPTDEYYGMKHAVLQAARRYECSPDAIEIQGQDFPEEIDW